MSLIAALVLTLVTLADVAQRVAEAAHRRRLAAENQALRKALAQQHRLNGRVLQELRRNA